MKLYFADWLTHQIIQVLNKSTLKLNKKYISAIKNDKKTDNMAAYQAMMEAVHKYNISKNTYVQEKFYLLDRSKLERYFSKNFVRARVDYISDEFDAPKGLVYQKILYAYSKYRIPIPYFAANNLYKNTSDDCLKFHSRRIKEIRQNNINELMSITGWDIDTTEQYVEDALNKYGIDLAHILENELFKKSDEEISSLIQENNAEEARRSKRIKEQTGWSDYEYERHRVNCRYRYRIHEIKTYDNLECWKLSTDVLDTYAVPKDAFILMDMYDTASTEVLNNKTLFDLTYKDFLGRKFWINKDSSLDEFKQFIEGLDAVFCKPINLNGGHGMYRYELNGTPEEMYEYFVNEPLMLIEEVIKQHHLINEIYPGCINSIRIMSVLKDDKFECFGAWMKFGANGSQVDGRIEGGSFAGVDEKTGIIVTTAIDGKNNRFECHPNTGVKILGFQIPFWKEVLELTERALRHVDGIDFVGWDVAITESGPVIVEGNSRPALADYQLLFAKDFGGMKKKYAHLLPPKDEVGYQTNTSGWREVSGKRYYYQYGVMQKSGWIILDGKKFYLAEDGHAMTDGWYTVDGNEYYFNCIGTMQIGWLTIDSNKYYLGTDGIRRTGWQNIGNNLYYFDENGVMQIS